MKPIRCAFLTKQHGIYDGQDDPLLANALERRGWSIEAVDWKDDEVAWEDFRCVLIRSPWDYYLTPDLFLKRISEIAKRCGALLHPESIIQANIHKRYLTQLGSFQDWVIPTEIHPSKELSALDWNALFRRFRCDRLILKPVVSAGSFRTLAVHHKNLREQLRTIEATFQDESVILQPFLPTICEDGEHSLVFLGGEYYHSILKRPKSGDFRVQVQHGGIYKRWEPDPWLVASSRVLLEDFQSGTLYARLDWVRNPNPDSPIPYLLMEIEMIEPDLYLRYTERGVEHYADLIVKRLDA
ncbi:ATP-grasp domain-containing protein [Pirellulaceae bacterium SH467]